MINVAEVNDGLPTLSVIHTMEGHHMDTRPTTEELRQRQRRLRQLRELIAGRMVGDAIEEAERTAWLALGDDITGGTTTAVATVAVAKLRWTVRPPALLDGTAEHTKAQVVVPVVRRAPAAERRTADAGAVAPTAAPVHPVRTRCSTSRIGH